MGGRRFIISMLIGAATASLSYLGKIDGNIYATVILGTVGAYITGNTYQKVKANAAIP
jgi:uncharacterized membrane protein YeaQ/YmgE (transglycosylase-associated protein family)